MEDKFNPRDIGKVLAERKHPTVMMWNRLEGRPRTHDFDRAMKAEIRDALWMLTRQWQMGEFNSDDAGSPVFAKVHISTSPLDRYRAASQQEQLYEENVPLEVKAEQKKILFSREGKEMSIDIRLQMGRCWLKLLKSGSLDLAAAYIAKYTFILSDPTRNTDHIHAHQEVWQQYAAISGRTMDGYQFLQHIQITGNQAADGITSDTGQISVLAELAENFSLWFEKLYYQPGDADNNAWLPDRLEYQFESSALSTTDTKTLISKEYHGGDLDWYAFDIIQKEGIATEHPKDTITETFIPAHVQFDGMPDTRWWKFEDGKTNLGAVKPSTTDLSKLLLMEFGLVYANDWFIFPQILPVGVLANIEGLSVRNNFGETIWVKAAEQENVSGEPWSMYKLCSQTQNNTLFLAPSAMKVQNGEPLENILLIRDEMSNMVWGIETVVPQPTGVGDKGGEAALRVRQYHENIVRAGTLAEPVPFAAKISYLAMTDVPENWIPFIPVHVAGDNRQTQLQRASMLRIIEEDPDRPVKIKPRTAILREGLDHLAADGTTPEPLAFYIHEEEVPRAGVRISESFQRTRWINGEVFVWQGIDKKTGKGEGSSNLAFDQIRIVEKS
jgi:hypothetical protein